MLFSNVAWAEYDKFQSERYGSFIKFEGIPNAVFFSDEIKDGDSFDLTRVLRDRQIDTIVLNSPGGLVKEGLQLASIINERGLTAYVPKGATCASACSFMFFAGKYRISNGALGVHQIALSEEESKKSAEVGVTQKNSQYVISQIIGFLTDFDTPPFVYEKMFQQEEMYYFLRTEIDQIEKYPAISKTHIFTEIDNFLSDFDKFLELIGCIEGSIECTQQQLCEIVYVDGEYSDEPSVKKFYDEIQAQGLDCRLMQVKATPPTSEKELTAAIQNELSRLGCLYDIELMDLVEAEPKFLGVVDWESIEALNHYLNADRNVEAELVNYENLDFLYRLVGINEAICKQKIQIYVDKVRIEKPVNERTSFGNLPIEIQELYNMTSGLRGDLLGPFDLEYVETVKKFNTNLDWQKLSDEGISYVVMLKRSSDGPRSIKTQIKVYDVHNRINLSTRDEISTSILEQQFTSDDYSIEAGYIQSKKISRYVRSLISSRTLNDDLKKSYVETANALGIMTEDDLRLYNEGIIYWDLRHEACSRFNELIKKYPNSEFSEISQDNMKQLECAALSAIIFQY